MTRLTFYGGVHQIGGTKVLLEDRDARVFLDFGTSFDDRGRFYEEYLQPRSSYGLLDPLAMGLLPPLRGLYRPDLEQVDPGLWDRFDNAPAYRDLRDVEIQGILLSHAHLDHTGYLSFVRPEVPVYASALTAFLAKAIQDSGRSGFETEVVYAAPRELHGSGLLTASNYRKVPSQQRPFNAFGYEGLSSTALAFWEATPASRDLDSVPLAPAQDVGGLEVRCYRVDHSIPGAAAYAIRTSAGWIGYTGDLRLHGSQKASTESFIEEMAALRPIVLVCEGTRAARKEGPAQNSGESDVEERAFDEVRRARGLAIADFGPRNVERLHTFARIARAAGRGLIILAKDAYLLDAAHLADPDVESASDLTDLYVYDSPALRVDKWQRQTREVHSDRLVSPDHIHRHQDQYILCFSFYDLNDLPTIRPQAGSLYLYSSHESFNEETQMDFQRLRNWVEHFDMRGVGIPLKELDWEAPNGEQGLHASGHASPDDLLRVARGIGPEVLVPVHTTFPEFFVDGLEDTGIRVQIPASKGVSMTFG